MRSRMLHEWLRGVLAVCALSVGPVWAGSVERTPEAVSARMAAGGDTWLDVSSTQGLRQGTWVLVQPGDADASWPWSWSRCGVSARGSWR